VRGGRPPNQRPAVRASASPPRLACECVRATSHHLAAGPRGAPSLLCGSQVEPRPLVLRHLQPQPARDDGGGAHQPNELERAEGEESGGSDELLDRRRVGLVGVFGGRRYLGGPRAVVVGGGECPAGAEGIGDACEERSEAEECRGHGGAAAALRGGRQPARGHEEGVGEEGGEVGAQEGAEEDGHLWARGGRRRG